MEKVRILVKGLIFCFLLGLFIGWLIRISMLEGFINEINFQFGANHVFKNLILYELFYGFLIFLWGLLIFGFLSITKSSFKNSTRVSSSYLAAVLFFPVFIVPIFSFIRCMFLKDIPLFFIGAPLWRQELGLTGILSPYGTFYVLLLLLICIILALLASVLSRKVAFLIAGYLNSKRVKRLFFVSVIILILLNMATLTREYFVAKEGPIDEVKPNIEDPVLQDTGNKVYLICFDGATWDVINPMMRDGKLPNFKKLLKESAYGDLNTVYPPYTKTVAPSILTGKLPHKTGAGKNLGIYNTNRVSYHIFSNIHKRLGFRLNWIINLTLRIYALPINILVRVFPSVEGASLVDVKANIILSKTINDILPLKNGIKAGFVHMPIIYEKAFSLIGSDIQENKKIEREFEKATSEFRIAATLPDEIKSFNLSDSGTIKKEVLKCLEEDLADNKAFKAISEMKPDFLFIWKNAMDSFGHLFGVLSRDDNLLIRKELRIKCKKAYELSYIKQDRFLGDILERRDENTTIIIISDHGFNLDTTSHIYSYTKGIFIINGKFSKGGAVIEGASVLDITPTVLSLLGYPVAEDMDGRVLKESIENKFWNKYPIRTLKTYGRKSPLDIHRLSEKERKRKLDRLKALGYL